MWEIQENSQKLQTKNRFTTGEKIITSPDEIADTCAEHYENISKEPHKKSKPGKREIRTAIEQSIHRQRTESSHKPTKEYSTKKDTIHSRWKKN